MQFRRLAHSASARAIADGCGALDAESGTRLGSVRSDAGGASAEAAAGESVARKFPARGAMRNIGSRSISAAFKLQHVSAKDDANLQIEADCSNLEQDIALSELPATLTDADIPATSIAAAAGLAHSEPANIAVIPTADDLDVARALAGNRDAFAALYKRHRGVVVRVVCRMGVPRSDLEDTIQEVFVQVHRSLRDFRAQAKFSTWLHRISVNVVLMQRRAQKSRPQYAPEPEVEVAGANALPDDDAERRERLRAFDRMLEKVAEKKRTVFMLHDIEGMSPQEIAEVVDAPVLTVRTRLFYARRDLEALLPSEPSLSGIKGAFGKAADGARIASELRATTQAATAREEGSES